MNPGGVLLDSCALLWFLEEAQFEEEARERAETAARALNLWISPINAWEVGLLAARGQLVLSMPVETWFAMILDLPGIGLSEISPKICIESSSLPGSPPGDIADRMLVATARTNGLTLITRDAALLEYAQEGHIRAVAC